MDWNEQVVRIWSHKILTGETLSIISIIPQTLAHLIFYARYSLLFNEIFFIIHRDNSV